MRKIIVGAMVSMDGVMQSPGGPSEDPTKGFTFGGWQLPFNDHVFREELDHLFEVKLDLLLGGKNLRDLRRLLAVSARRHREIVQRSQEVCRLALG
jgi:hypothetical protein